MANNIPEYRYMCYLRGLTTLKQNPPLTTDITLIDVSFNQLQTLEGIEHLKHLHTIRCMDNRLETLKGVPYGIKNIYASGNEIKTLEHIPLTIEELILDRGLEIEFMDKYKLWGDFNVKEIAFIEFTKRFVKGLEKLRLLRLHYLVYKAWHNYWYDQRDEKGHSRACKHVARQLVN